MCPYFLCWKTVHTKLSLPSPCYSQIYTTLVILSPCPDIWCYGVTGEISSICLLGTGLSQLWMLVQESVCQESCIAVQLLLWISHQVNSLMIMFLHFMQNEIMVVEPPDFIHWKNPNPYNLHACNKTSKSLNLGLPKENKAARCRWSVAFSSLLWGYSVRSYHPIVAHLFRT